MTHRSRSPLLAGLAAAAFAAAGPAMAQPQLETVNARALSPAEISAAKDDSLLVFGTAAFDPRSQQVQVPSLALEPSPTSPFSVVQFDANADAETAALKALGIEVLGYQPHNAYVVRADAKALARAEQLPQVSWVGGFRSEWKLHPALLQPQALVGPVLFVGSGEMRSGGAGLQVTGFAGTEPAALAAAAHKLAPAGEVLQTLNLSAYPTVRFWVPQDRLQEFIERLAGEPEVQHIAPYVPETLSNTDAVEPIQASAGDNSGLPTVTPIWDQDLIGTGQKVAVTDSGLDRNEDWFVGYDDGTGVNVEIIDAESPVPPATGTIHPDAKVYAYWIQPGATAYDGTSAGFHGTHVSGTVVGDSIDRATATTPNYNDADGMAPHAQILFQDIGVESTGGLSITDLEGTLQQAHAGDAHISSGSWGASTAGGYNANSATSDQVTWLNEDDLVMFAAGNDGPGSSTVGAPSTAKNAVSVGALGHGNSTSVASFSSRGPAADGRLQPDIMAPGTGTRSAAGDTDNSDTVDPPEIAIISGTSMATPTVSGGTALLRQYFTEGFYPTGARNPADEYVPTGALMKAVMINGAETALAGTVPSNDYGWGRMFLDNNLFFNSAARGTADSRYLRFWDVPKTAGLQTGQSDTYQVDVGPGEELRITLIWFDPPAAIGAGQTLVNDLHLEVDPPGGGTILGNSVAAGGPNSTNDPDTINTVENVSLPTPAGGSYTLRVVGASVPGTGVNFSDRQGYALVLSAATPASPLPASAPTTVAATDNGANGIDVSFNAPTRGNLSYNIYRAPGDCTATNNEFRLVGTTNTTSFTDERVIGGFTYSYAVREVIEREGPISTCDATAVATSTAECNLLPEFDQQSVQAMDAAGDLCANQVTWDAGTSTCPAGTDLRYNVYRSTDPLFAPAPGNLFAADVEGLSFDDDNPLPDTTHYYVVRAEDSTDPENGNESTGTRRVKATSLGDGDVAGTFEDNPDSLSLLEVGDPWSVSDDQAASGSFSYRSAPDDASEYTNNTCAFVTTPEINLQAGAPEMTYQARWDLEADWDGVVVQLSTDGGSTWQDLPPDSGYPGDFSQTMDPPINGCGFPASQGAYNGSSGGIFQQQTTDLSTFAGQSVMIRWALSTDPATQEEGFYLDDLSITDASRPAMCFQNQVIYVDGFEDQTR